MYTIPVLFDYPGWKCNNIGFKVVLSFSSIFRFIAGIFIVN